MGKLIDLTGRRFGRWTVVATHRERAHNRHVLWRCRCDCGTERVVSGSCLRQGGSTSCGCFHREKVGKQFTKHGLSGTRVYHIYQHMLERCRNPNNCAYAWYGARGIDVECSFEEFFADVGHPPPGLTIERIDNHDNYKVGNLKWVTRSEQARNRRPPKRKLGNVKIYSGRMIKRGARRAKLAERQNFVAALARAKGGGK
jgi:hypothetical protein